MDAQCNSTRNSSGDEIANVTFLYDDIVHVLQNTIHSCINSATDRRGYVLERMFTKCSEITNITAITKFTTKVYVCQNLSKLSDSWQSYSKNNLVQFFAPRGILHKFGEIMACYTKITIYLNDDVQFLYTITSKFNQRWEPERWEPEI